MNAPLPLTRSSWIYPAPLLLVLSVLVRFGAAGEIIVESVRPAGSPAAVTPYGVTREDYSRIATALPEAQAIIPLRTMPVQAVYGDRELSLQLVGTVPEYRHLDKRKLEQGRFLTRKDVDTRNNVTVIDTFTARRLFPHDRAVGKNIRISNHYFLVVGVITSDSEALHANRETSMERRIFIPRTTMRSRYGDVMVRTRTGSMQVDSYELSRIHVLVAAAADVNHAAAVIEALLKNLHEKRDYTIKTSPAGHLLQKE